MPRACPGETVAGGGEVRNDEDRVAIRTYFESHSWELLDECRPHERLHMPNGGYEGQVFAAVARLLLKGKVEC